MRLPDRDSGKKQAQKLEAPFHRGFGKEIFFKYGSDKGQGITSD